MKSRSIAMGAAIILALIGLLLIFTFIGGAEDRAMANLEPTKALIVKTAVPVGTPAESLAEFVTTEEVPKAALAPSALKNLDGTAGKVTAVDLVPGEQLLAERLEAPEELSGGRPVDVPKGLQEVSFQLEPQRVVGGRLVAGEHVGVFISMDKGGIEASPDKETTQLVVRKALLTAIQRAPQPATEEGGADAQALPEGSMLVTVAVDDKAAQKIVFAAEFAKIWLSKEPEDAKESKPEVVQRSEVYR
jgi:pilus assembly protein CpaB